MKKTLLGLTGFFIFTTLSAITPGLEEYIEVTSTPKGAVISVSKDGGKTYHKIGKTPLKALIKLESLVRLEMEGYKTAEKQISGDIFVSGKLEIKLKWDEEKEKQRKEEEKKALEAEAKKKAEEEAARKAEEE
ncbi:MAG TPA: hypothetical protein DHW82_13250, partial [Spirochaetia bacterium]|nr:hypothetical protein [Spirochaetia bacterium]